MSEQITQMPVRVNSDLVKSERELSLESERESLVEESSSKNISKKDHESIMQNMKNTMIEALNKKDKQIASLTSEVRAYRQQRNDILDSDTGNRKRVIELETQVKELKDYNNEELDTLIRSNKSLSEDLKLARETHAKSQALRARSDSKLEEMANTVASLELSIKKLVGALFLLVIEHDEKDNLINILRSLGNEKAIEIEDYLKGDVVVTEDLISDIVTLFFVSESDVSKCLSSNINEKQIEEVFDFVSGKTDLTMYKVDTKSEEDTLDSSINEDFI